MPRSLRNRLRVNGPVDLTLHDTRATPGTPGHKSATKKALAKDAERLAQLQERLYAEDRRDGAKRRLLLVLQGMDTSGKGGTIKHVAGAVNPQGVRIAAFKKPTEEELGHHFLWRIRKQLPAPGEIGIFDRSHYEDVLVVRVHELVEPATCERRYDEINRFEAELADDGVTVVKVFLHISYDEQRERLLARLDDTDKHWKLREGDIDERSRWPDYMAAYEAALERCSTDTAPWYVVPADRKWYRDWAVSRLLIEALEEMDPQYPRPDLDVVALKERLAPPN